MKRIISLLMIIPMMFLFTACRKDNTSGSSDDSYTYESEIITIIEDGEGTGESVGNQSDASKVNSSKNPSSTSGNSSNNDTKITTVDGLDFGGRTIKMAITNDKTPTESEKRMFADFEKTYNCKLKYDIFTFDSFLKTISNKIAAKEPYDIVYIHGSMFPTAAISRLLAPLDEAICDNDKFNISNAAAGGIDMDKSSYFKWNNKFYAVSGYNDVNLYFMYYNKQKFKAGNLPDPLELYNAGQWTWEKVVEIGKKVTDTNKRIYFGDGSFVEKSIVESFGGHYIKRASDKDVKENTSDPKIFNGLKFIQRISTGADQIISLESNASNPSEFLAGRTYAFISEDIRYAASISKSVIDSKKLGGDINNVGIVPLPLGDGNKEYPAGWIQGIAACRGVSDITPAVAFAKFRSKWKDSQTDNYQLPQYAQDLRLKLISNINYVDYGYSSGATGTAGSVSSIVHAIEYDTACNKDIKTVLETYKNSIQNCIDVTLKKQ